ncbi:HTH_Tnp_Tc3_2 domain-containing protein [Trichonephila clavipes]|uniref:HTH_Tnp_Tc3_2 domain-containing protein n=1 Tax=Trichonephila clavipes TaxID=2585209 RepID=A0A8X6W027_TRICX|nr:HTH_Tnp_Tc3_2 domain-containing protein [Trichonephila clavipes]
MINFISNLGAEDGMHVKRIKARIPHIAVTWKLEEGCRLRCQPRHLTEARNYNVCHQLPSCFFKMRSKLKIKSNETDLFELINLFLSRTKFVLTFSNPDWFKKTKSVENKLKSGRPRIYNEHEKKWIVRQVHINPRTSAAKMALQCKSRFGKSVNPESVRNVLRKQVSWQSTSKKPCIVKKQIDKLGWHLLKCM